MVVHEVAAGQAGLPCPESTHSYWHKEPSQVLLGHRTTADLPPEADVVIVGSGITGAFAAHFLKRGTKLGDDSAIGRGEDGSSWAEHLGRDLKIVMLEAREACWGATGRNGGHCQPMVFSSPPDVATFELATFRFLRELVEKKAIPCDWVSLRGVTAFLTDSRFQDAVHGVGRLENMRPDLAAQIDVVFPTSGPSGGPEEPGQKPVRQQPSLTLESLRIPSAVGALVQRNAASLWPYKLVAWVLEALLRDFPAPAFNLQTKTPVLKVHHRRGSNDDDGPGASSSSSNDSGAQRQSRVSHPWIVTTPRGRIAARAVLVCANGYTSRLVPAFADLIVPVRGQVASLLPPAPDHPARVSHATAPLPPPNTQPSPVHLQYSYNWVEAGPPRQPRGPDREDYLVQRPVAAPDAGELILGGERLHSHGYSVGEWRDDLVERDVAARLRRALPPILDLKPAEGDGRGVGQEDEAEAEELAATFEWTGIMGYSRDQRPWVGRVPVSLWPRESGASGTALPDDNDNGDSSGAAAGLSRGLWVCGGYGGHGMPSAALCARAVVKMMTTREGDNSDNIELPQSFLLTEERVTRARERCVTVAEQEARGDSHVLWR